MNNNHPLVQFVVRAAGAIGGAALANALVGTTVVVTTSWLMVCLAYIVYACMLLAGAAVGEWAAVTVAKKLAPEKFEGCGYWLGRFAAKVMA